MAMGSGTGDRGSMSEINVTPLVDVMLVLLIIFMVTTPMMSQGIPVQLPQASKQSIDMNMEESTILTIAKDGAVYIDDRPIPANKLEFQLRRLYSELGTRNLFLRGDRRVPYGGLADFAVLDTRQYRTDQPCGDGTKVACEAVFDPKATIMGDRQEAWLKETLDKSPAKWNIIANQVLMARIDQHPGPEEWLSMDQWSGYEANRDRLMKFLAERKPSRWVEFFFHSHPAISRRLAAAEAWAKRA